MSYVLAVVTQFNTGLSDEVLIKERGRAISRAVDTAEVVRNKFMHGVAVKDIKMGTVEPFFKIRSRMFNSIHPSNLQLLSG